MGPQKQSLGGGTHEQLKSYTWLEQQPVLVRSKDTKVTGRRCFIPLKATHLDHMFLFIQVLSNLLPPMSKKRSYGYVFHLCVLFPLDCCYIENHSCPCLLYVILKPFCFKHCSLNYKFGGEDKLTSGYK